MQYPIPFQFIRQYAGPIDIDTVFNTTAARLAYLSSPRRYAGMIVVDKQQNAAYFLSTANTWVSLTGGGGGGSITAVSPLVYDTGTGLLSIPEANATTNGYLRSVDWTTFNDKENAITAGTTSQYFRGDKTFQTLNTTVVPEGTNLYLTNSRVIESTLTGYTAGAGTITASDTILSSIQKLSGNLLGFIPYTGATSNIALGLYGLSSNHLQLSVNPTSVPTSVGTISWDNFYGTSSIVLSGGNVSLKVGQDSLILVRNNTATNLVKGQVVYITGSTGEIPTIALASNANDVSSSVTLGLLSENININSTGYVTTSGIVHGLNTNPYNEGSAVWLGTNGNIVQDKPVAPDHAVLIGYVIKKAGGNGSIFVKIQNGYELEELHDVSLPTYINNGILYRDTTTNLWKTASIATVLGYTPANDSNVVTLNGVQTISGDKTFNNIYANGSIVSPNQLVTKEYVDLATSSGLSIHTPVRVETTGNLTATYTVGGTTPIVTSITTNDRLNTSVAHGLSSRDVIVFNTTTNGLTAGVAYFVFDTPTTTSFRLSTTATGGVINTLVNGTSLTINSRANAGVGATLTNSGAQSALSIDGVNLIVGDRVLVYRQTNSFENGVYTVTNIGSGSTNWVLTRATTENKYGLSSTTLLGQGDYFFVREGLTGAGESYVLTTSTTIVFGTTGLTFTQFSGTISYTGGTNIIVSGQTISLSGQVGVANGGTGVSTLTGIPVGNGTSAFTSIVGTANQLLRRNSGNTAYEFFSPNYLIPTSLSASQPLAYDSGTGVFTIGQSSTSSNGFLSSTDWNTFNNKQSAITLTTTGSSGASTFISNTLNIPNYTLSGLGGQPLSTNLTSLAALSFVSSSLVRMTAIGTFSLDTNTYLTSNQTITLSGNITGSGTTAITTTIANNVVTNAMLAQVSSGTLRGRVTAGTGNVENLTGTQATTLLDIFTTTLKGLVPSSGGGTTNFLRADGTWAAPPGGGGGGTTTNAITFNSSGSGSVSGTTFNGSTAVTVSHNTIGAQPLNANLSNISGLSFVSNSFVKMTGSGVFSLDTNTYITGNQTITLSGDISGSGTTAITTTIGNNAVTLAKFQQVSTSSFLGRVTAATGNIEVLTGTQATTLLDIFTSTLKGLVPASAGGTTNFLRADGTWAPPPGGGGGGTTTFAVTFNNSGTGAASGTTFDGSVARTISHNTIGAQPLATNLTSLASLSFVSNSFVRMTASGTFSLDTNTYLVGNQNITLSGDVTGSGSTGITVTISNNVVTLAKLQQVSTSSFLGRVTASTGNVEVLTGTQATTLLDVFTSTLKGLVPSSGGGTTNFLRADGTWTAPAGSGTTTNSVTFNNSGSGSASGVTFNGSTAITISHNTIGAQPLATNLTSLAGLSFVSNSFVRMSAAGTFSLDTNTYLTSNQTITLSGDVTGNGTTAITTTIANNVVTLAKLQQISTSSFLGRVTAGTGNVENLTGTQATTLLDVFTSTLKGLVPASAGGTTNFLRADGTWAAPSAGGAVTSFNTRTGAITLTSSDVTSALGFTPNKVITSGTALPSGGVDGDIYLQFV